MKNPPKRTIIIGGIGHGATSAHLVAKRIAVKGIIPVITNQSIARKSGNTLGNATKINAEESTI